MTGKHILKVCNTDKQNKDKFSTRTLSLTKTIPFTSTPKVSKNDKTSKQSVEGLKKAFSENISESKQLYVEKPDNNNTLEISKERDNENTLLTTSNCDGDHQPPSANKNNLFHLTKHFLLSQVLNILWKVLFQKLSWNKEESFISMIRANTK